MIDDEATTRRWITGIFATLLAVALYSWMHPAAGAASHLPFVLAMAFVAVAAGRGPATLVLAGALAVTVWRMVDGSAALPESLAGRAAVLSGYAVLATLIIYIGHSARRHAQESNRARAELDMALTAADVGTWNYDFKTGALRYSANVGPMMGRPAGFVHPSIDDWKRDIHPDDLPALTESLRAASRGESYQVRYRIRTPTGDWHWLLVRGKVARDGQRRSRHADGVLMDITGVRKAELDRWRSDQELRTMLDLIPAGVVIAHDTKGHRITVSPRFARILGVDEVTNALFTGEPEKLPYRCMRNGVAMSGDDLPTQVAARTGREVHDFQMDLVFDEERTVNLLSSAAPLFDADGNLRGAIGVHTDITALKQAQLELERMDRQKDIFIATLAHELRNPLAPMRYAAMMLRRGVDAEAVAQSGRIIERQTAHMGRLLDELLDMSRVTRDVIELRRDSVDLARVLRQEVQALQPQLTELSHRLDVEAITSAWVIGDETRLHQVVGNLLGNAVKFTRPGGRIEVTLGIHGDELELKVRDNGIGISGADLPHVFDLFTQIRKPGSSPGSGLGIGLAVVRRLVQLHGGRISAASDGVGVGAEFVVHLPRATDPGNGDSQAGKPTVELLRHETRVLVCDDNVDAADTLAQLLRQHGFDVRVTYDGLGAMRSADEFRPDIVLLDLGLPDISGEDVARWIRSTAWGLGVVLIAVTGWGQDRDRARTAEAGFGYHLVKPVDPRELLALLGRRAGAAKVLS